MGGIAGAGTLGDHVHLEERAEHISVIVQNRLLELDSQLAALFGVKLCCQFINHGVHVRVFICAKVVAHAGCAAGREEILRVAGRCCDHRSNAARGLDEIPTIHEGVTAQALERKGIISDRCEINRQIREQNKLIRAIRDEITKLKNTIMTSVPALAKALETARKGILLLRYS